MRRTRSVVSPLALLALVVAFAPASCGGEDEPPPTTETTQTTTTTVEPPPGPTVVRVRVVDGVPRGGIVRETVDKGDRVVLVVTSDVADHVHLHGYDLFRDLVPGRTARIRFRATLAGRFLVELEDRHTQIAELTVQP